MDSRKSATERLLSSLSFRLILLMLASGLGLWLGAGARSATAGKVTVQRENPGKWLIADAFRFDILLARAEPAKPPADASAARTESQTRPAAVVVARSEPVETVEVPLRVALDLRGPGPLRIHARMQPENRPAGVWRMRIEGQVAQLRQTERQTQEILRGLPGLAPVEMIQKRLECELQRASKTLEALELDEPAPGPATGAAAEVSVVGTPHATPPGCTN
jgi:hypothetical protein